MSINSSVASAMRGCLRAHEAPLPRREAWRLRRRTLRAMALLCVAQAAVKLVPFRYWRATLGQPGPGAGTPEHGDIAAAGRAGPARRIAVHVERGAARLPFAAKCLPRAMVLCWLLRRAGVAYTLRIAARPSATQCANLAADDDTLHAWVEAEDTIVIGALPGPWLVMLNLSG